MENYVKKIPETLLKNLKDVWTKNFNRSLPDSLAMLFVKAVYDYFQVDSLDSMQKQYQVDCKALSDELEYADEWDRNLPNTSRVVRDFIEKFREYKKTMAELIPVAKDLQEDNNELTEKNTRLTRSRDAAWRSFHAVNGELIPMREQVERCVKIEQDCERYREERDALSAENTRLKKQYQNDLSQRIATISEMQEQLKALTERVKALQIDMH